MTEQAANPASPPQQAPASGKDERNRNILVILWGFILAKCFAVEYLVRVYTAPIDSVIYIWTPTLIFATVASVVYLALAREESLLRRPKRFDLSLWSTAAVAAIAVTAANPLGLIDGYLVPAGYAVILGLYYFLLSGVSPHRLLFRIAAGGWFVSAAAQFFAADIGNLLLFAVSLLAFTVIPVAVLMLRR